MFKLIDRAAAKGTKRFQEKLSVAEVDTEGKPTGKTLEVPKISGPVAQYEEREKWLKEELAELEKLPDADKLTVTVLRGSDDDVIGIITTKTA